MELIGVEIQGFRRFDDSVKVRLLENVIAIVGQNEAGKTSFLEALEELNSTDAVAGRDQTRRVDTSTEIMARFKLEESDLQNLRGIDGGDEIKQCCISKKAGGNINVELEPAPSHAVEPRKRMRSDLESIIGSETFDGEVSEELIPRLNNLMKTLNSDKEHLDNSEIRSIEETANYLGNWLEGGDSEKNQLESIENIKKGLEKLAKKRKSVLQREQNSC